MNAKHMQKIIIIPKIVLNNTNILYQIILKSSANMIIPKIILTNFYKMPSFTNVTDHGSRCTHGIPYYWGRSTKVRSRTTRYLLDLARYLKGTRYLAKVTLNTWPRYRYPSIPDQDTGTSQYLAQVQVLFDTWPRYR